MYNILEGLLEGLLKSAGTARETFLGIMLTTWTRRDEITRGDALLGVILFIEQWDEKETCELFALNSKNDTIEKDLTRV